MQKAANFLDFSWSLIPKKGTILNSLEVLILSLVRLQESSFDQNGSLVIVLKPHLDLSSSSTIRDSLELKKQKTQEKNTLISTICIMPILLLEWYEHEVQAQCK
jgi:hypothetical protein